MSRLPPLSVNELKPWLEQHLEPICDAEPAVLADYILALLKHDLPLDQLHALCVEQLDDFLDTHTKPFVDSLLSHLTSTPSSSASSAPGPRPGPPSNAPTGPSKRSASDAALPSAPSPKQQRRGPDLAQAPVPGAQGLAQAGTGSQPCRDYHFRGFCARGDSCPYAHDLPSDSPALSHARSNLPPPSSANGPGGFPPGVPIAPNGIPYPFLAMAAAQQGVPFPFGGGGAGGGGGFAPGRQGGGPAGPFGGGGRQPQQQQPVSFQQREGPPGPRQNGPRPPRQPHQQQDGGRGGGGRPATAPPRSSRLLLVENIPPPSLTDQAVRHFFTPFGQILSLSLDLEGRKAEIAYERPQSADRAVRSEQAVFGNRFVRVYRVAEEASEVGRGLPPLPPPSPRGQNGEEGQTDQDGDVAFTSAGQPPLSSSSLNGAAPSFSASPHAPPFRPAPRPRSSFPRAAPPPSDPLPPLLSRLTAITQKQRDLLSALDDPSADAQRKKAVMGVLRALREEGEGIEAKIKAIKAEKEKEGKEKEGEAGETKMEEGEGGQDEEEPLVKLQRLRDEAARLGLDSNGAAPPPPPSPAERSYRPFPARGRGRGGARGGGVVHQRPHKLDNRSSGIVVPVKTVEGVEQWREKEEGVRGYFETYGTVTTVTFDAATKEAVVNFSLRKDAEKAMAAGPSALPSSLGLDLTPSPSLRWSGTAAFVPPPASAGPSTAGEDTRMKVKEGHGEVKRAEGESSRFREERDDE